MHKDLERGYRESGYQILGDAAKVGWTMGQDPAGRAALFKSVPDLKTNDVIYAAVFFTSGGSSEKARKRASKKACVLTYLIKEQKVALDDLAEGIKKYGGWEKISRLAARETPRKKKRASRTKSERPYPNGVPQLVISSDLARKMEKIPFEIPMKLIGRRHKSSNEFEVERVVRSKDSKPALAEGPEADDWED